MVNSLHFERALISLDDVASAPPSCAWDYEFCADSGCCRGASMQCYAKDGEWSSCKPHCVPGPDPWDVDGRPWTCAALGPRAEPLGAEETCNPGRFGANFWSGKQLYLGRAESEASCSAACAVKPGCGAWAWHEELGGNCLLSASVSPPSPVQLSTLLQGGAPSSPCRMAAQDLPASRCAASGRDCSSSWCCEVAGEQCYRKDASTATCQAGCRPGGEGSCQKLGPRVCPACQPVLRKRPAIVIPTYEHDVCKAVVLAKSIAMRDPNHLLGDVYVLWVSTEPMLNYKDQFNEIERAISAGRQFYLMDFSAQLQNPDPRCVLFGPNQECIAEMYGWFAQMVLKLKIASLVYSEYYVVLDSKNAFISDIEEDTFFTACNAGKILGQFRHKDLPEPHKSWYDSSARQLGLDVSDDVLYPTSVTPAVFHTKTVLEMLEHIGERTDPRKFCDGPLCSWFAKWATEFTLYTLFAFAKVDFQCIHSLEAPGPHNKQWDIGLWAGDAYLNLELCENVERARPKPVMFSLQADVLQQAGTQAGMSLREGQWMKGRLRDCLLGIYVTAGLFDGSLAEADNFTACIA